jgi:hypothetical protein
MESTDQAIRIPLLEANAELPAREAVLERFRDLVFTRRSAVATPEESAFFAEAELDEPAPAVLAAEFEPALPVVLDAFAATPAKYEFLEDSMEVSAESIEPAPAMQWDEEPEPAQAAAWDEEPAEEPEPAPAHAAAWDEEPQPEPAPVAPAPRFFDAAPDEGPEEATAAFRWDDAELAEEPLAAAAPQEDLHGLDDAGGFDAEPESEPAPVSQADFSWNDEDAAAGTFEPEPAGLEPDEEKTGMMAAFDEGAFDEPEPEPEPEPELGSDSEATSMMAAFDESLDEPEGGEEGGEGSAAGGDSADSRKKGRRGRGRRSRR